MGKVIQFLSRMTKERRKDAMFRAYGRHRQRHQRMQEAAEKRKRPKSMQDCLADQ